MYAIPLAFAALVALSLRIAWHPPIATYVQYVPIAAVFAALVCDRVVAAQPLRARAAFCDVAVVVLALMRVFVPPLPFVSGHMLLATYGAVTANSAALRVFAIIALAEVIYTKVFAGGGIPSMLGGLTAALALAWGRGLNGKW